MSDNKVWVVMAWRDGNSTVSGVFRHINAMIQHQREVQRKGFSTFPYLCSINESLTGEGSVPEDLGVVADV